MEARVRAAALAVLLAVLAVSPGAEAAGLRPSAPLVVAVHRSEAGATIAWTPVAGAAAYAVLRGPDPGNMTTIATVTATAYHDPTPGDGKVLYAVASVALHASPPSPPVGGDEDCVAVGRDLSVSASPSGCLRTLP